VRAPRSCGEGGSVVCGAMGAVCGAADVAGARGAASPRRRRRTPDWQLPYGRRRHHDPLAGWALSASSYVSLDLLKLAGSQSSLQRREHGGAGVGDRGSVTGERAELCGLFLWPMLAMFGTRPVVTQ
jgi:hypothetical protein